MKLFEALKRLETWAEMGKTAALTGAAAALVDFAPSLTSLITLPYKEIGMRLLNTALAGAVGGLIGLWRLDPVRKAEARNSLPPKDGAP